MRHESMTLEQYNQLLYDYAHCAGTHCEKVSQCLRHTASEGVYQ